MRMSENFIKEFAFYVRKHAPTYSIKVYSPIIAQGILESNKGRSELAINANNFLGLKYRPDRCPTAYDVYYKVGSEQNADGTYTSSAMKWCKFKNMEDCIIGYFDFINNSRYSKLKGVTDPETYLKLIKAAGYATSLNYVDNLMEVIKSYNLTQYDEEMELSNMKKVFLSAGHGGSDPGATYKGLYEETVNLNTLLACKTELERHGVTVIASRTKDENDPVAEETREANASGADIAVSFHANAGGGDGFEAFYYSTSKNGKRLATLCEKYVKQLGQNSRGIKTGDKLYFVRNTTMPAVLVESFFVDNDKDRLIGDTVDEQRAFGVAYAKAILEFLGIAYNEKVTSNKPAPSTGGSKLYKVQVGAYSVKENAENTLTRLKIAGFDGIIVEE